MKKKTIIILLTTLVIIILICFSEYYGYSISECQYCVLSDYVFNGKVEEVILKEGDSINVNDLKFNMQAEPYNEPVNVDDKERYTQKGVDECFSKVFKQRKTTIHIADESIAIFKDDKIISQKKGTTKASIKVVAEVNNDLKCGSPPKFEDEITILIN